MQSGQPPGDAIVAQNASKLFLDGTVVAFRQLNLSVRNQEILCIVGPSGCGKTTFLRCIAVEFRTHFFNRASRRGIERLGAKMDGILRSHQIGANGTLRDTVVYSIIASEWPTVKQHLTFALER